HRNGLLALDSGVYDATEHRGNYYARTIAHNTVTVTDPREAFGGATWGGGRTGSGANDGGQMYVGGSDLIGDVASGAYARGEIVAYQNHDEFTYVVGDATASYSPDKVKEFTRAFLFIRPSVFVVFDRVESADASFTKRWLLHTATEPRVVDEALFEVHNGASTLAVHTLAPDFIDTTVIGGEGDEFNAAGANYPPKKRYDADAAGRWRVEVSPSDANERDYYLHVLGVDAGTLDTRLEENDEYMLVHIRCDQGVYEAQFTKTGPLTSQVTLRREAEDSSVTTTGYGLGPLVVP
ncbi:hypothetical protein CMK11_11175, partial [Candidatus Poribacteria bacterium]|nr:hypothetical protein [Candidatus Poribacteria bacterium]